MRIGKEKVGWLPVWSPRGGIWGVTTMIKGQENKALWINIKARPPPCRVRPPEVRRISTSCDQRCRGLECLSSYATPHPTFLAPSGPTNPPGDS